MADVFCFSCGASTVALGQRVVPICANCRARGVVGRSTEANWMVRLPGGSTRGPLGKQAVLGWLARGRIGPNDRISPVGGDESAIADHPDFRGCFIPGSVDEQAIQSLRNEFHDIEKRAKVRRLMTNLGAVLFLIGAGALVLLSHQSRMLVFPVDIIVQIETGVQTVRQMIAPGQEYAPIPVASELPHSDWADAQGKDRDYAAYQRGQMAHWMADSNHLEKARREYLAAIAASPTDAMAHAGLIVVNAEMLGFRPELLGEISRAATRLDILASGSPAAARANGALALAKGNRLGAAESTKACRALDAGCALIYGEATRSVQEVVQVQKRFGSAPRVLRTLAKTAFAADDLVTLSGATDELVRRLPNDPIGLELRAEYFAAIGMWEAARESLAKARALGSESPASRHLEAAIAVQVDRDLNEGIALYRKLSESHLLRGYEGRFVVLLQGAIAAAAAKEFDVARSFLAGVSGVDAEAAQISMTRAIIDFESGNQEAAETTLRDIDTAGLEEDEEALIHLWSAYIYLEGGKQRLARTEIEEAERIRPQWHRLYQEKIWAELQAKNIGTIMEALTAMMMVPASPTLRSDPRIGIGLDAPPARPYGGPLLRAMDDDIRFERLREPAAAMISWNVGREGALSHLIEVDEVTPDHIGVQAALAAAYFDSGNWQRATQYALKVVGRKPNTPWMQSIRGRAMANSGVWTEAKDVLGRSTRGEVADVRMLQWAAETWMARGEVQTAKALLEEAQKMAPNDAILRRSLLAAAEGKE